MRSRLHTLQGDSHESRHVYGSFLLAIVASEKYIKGHMFIHDNLAFSPATSSAPPRAALDAARLLGLGRAAARVALQADSGDGRHALAAPGAPRPLARGSS